MPSCMIHKRLSKPLIPIFGTTITTSLHTLLLKEKEKELHRSMNQLSLCPVTPCSYSSSVPTTLSSSCTINQPSSINPEELRQISRGHRVGLANAADKATVAVTPSNTTSSSSQNCQNSRPQTTIASSSASRDVPRQASTEGEKGALNTSKNPSSFPSQAKRLLL